MVDILFPMLHFTLRMKMETKIIPCSAMMENIHSHPHALIEGTHNSAHVAEARGTAGQWSKLVRKTRPSHVLERLWFVLMLSKTELKRILDWPQKPWMMYMSQS